MTIDPTGLQYDRRDTEQAAVPVPDGVEVFHLGTRNFDIPEVTPDTLGLTDDRIAQVLHLSALLGKAIQALTPAERDELTRNYAWPTRVMRAAGIGRVA